MVRVLRWLYFSVLVRPVITLILGLNVRGREHLPRRGPAIITANHNSHLDAMVLMSLLPHRLLHKVRPVAAEDYFMKNRFLAWFSTRIVGILPIARKRSDPDEDPLAGCYQALERGEILIFFPEGSRGKPEQMGEFRAGIAKVAARFPNVPVFPVFMHGLGKALPRGEGLLVPFMLDIFVGSPIQGRDYPENFLVTLRERIETLARDNPRPEWD
ncbi:MAG: 1-acyl-sn-glycerol-3-phosphate acyltransferase [Wenzhouxiangella sp.]|nr:MAG: 1-acyl-sn-glycerol-3-phosphate acyltransferase [Wenzhouxiangella sp.]